MKVAVEELESCKRRLAVEAPLDIVQKEWEKAYGRVQKRARACPASGAATCRALLVKLHFADDVRREVAEHLIPDVYRQALSEAQIAPVNEPDLQDLKLEEDAPLSFTAVVEVKPAITARRVSRRRGAARAVPGDRRRGGRDAGADARAARRVPQRRARRRHRRHGDRRLHAGAPGPRALRPPPATTSWSAAARCCRRSTRPRSASPPGRSVTWPVSFADDHRMETLRGKGGTAHLKLTEVKEKILPALDDDFAKVLGQFETLGRRADRGAQPAGERQ